MRKEKSTMNNYKVRFNYVNMGAINAPIETDWYPVTAYTPTEALLLVLNAKKVSMGQLIYLEIKRI